MPSLGAMKARIENEIARTDLTAEIAAAIASAVDHYDGQRFWFTEAIGTFSTAPGQEWYSAANFPALTSVRTIDTVRALLPGRWLCLVARPWSEVQERSEGIPQSQDPTEWTYYRGQMRLWPVPNAVRTIEVAYIGAIGIPMTDGASNAWTTEAEEMIRMRAKVDLFENVIRDPAEADRLRAREADAFARLKRISERLQGSGNVQAYYL